MQANLSRNLVELVRRHHEQGAPTALEVLKEAIEQRGEITDDDRRVAAERSGLPEAAVYGVSTFYDDLLVAARARATCACAPGRRASRPPGDEHVDRMAAGSGLEARRAQRGRVRLAWPRPSASATATPSPAVRDGDVIDAGPGAIERVLNRATSRARRDPTGVQQPHEPVLTRPGDWSGYAGAPELTPEELLDEVKAANVRGRGGAGFPAGNEVGVRGQAAEGDREVHRRQRRRGRPRLLHRQAPDGATTRHLLLEGMALAGFAVGAEHGFVLVRSEYPRSKPTLDAAAIGPERLLGIDIAGTGFDFDVT